MWSHQKLQCLSYNIQNTENVLCMFSLSWMLLSSPLSRKFLKSNKKCVMWWSILIYPVVKNCLLHIKWTLYITHLWKLPCSMVNASLRFSYPLIRGFLDYMSIVSFAFFESIQSCTGFACFFTQHHFSESFTLFCLAAVAYFAFCVVFY